MRQGIAMKTAWNVVTPEYHGQWNRSGAYLSATR